MKKIFLFAVAVIFSFGSCVLNENKTVIEEFVKGANEEFVAMGNVAGVNTSKCEYRDDTICFDFQLDIPEEYMDSIDFTELRDSYLNALKTNVCGEEYYLVFKAMSEENCIIKYRFSTSSGKEICFEINPNDLID